MTRPPREPDLESGFPSPTIVDSRRLMGPNLMHAGLGAVLDVSLDDSATARNAVLLTAWHARVASLAESLGWTDAETTQRVYPGGASLFVHAPIDQLMTATEVTESAWVFAEAIAEGVVAPDPLTSLPALAAFAAAEAVGTRTGRRTLVELWNEAQRLGLNLTFDETSAFVGTGVGSQGWPLDAIPFVENIDWLAVRDIPIVLVTGSNGKTTVVRMIAHMAKAAGHTVGYTCTDGVWVNGVQVESGDYSGPAGARRVVQDPAVTFAVLECARGGMLRRGLAVQRAAVATIVTLSADHFGDYGIVDLDTLAEAKLIVGRAVVESGTLVYNASIPTLASAVKQYSGHTVPVSVDDTAFDPAMLASIPATLHGTATHNVLNAQIALTVANALSLGPDPIASLGTFGASALDNMGRLMLYTVGDVTIVVDYAHNPQSIAALIEATRSITATRRAITLGTGGDRDDVALAAIATAAFDSGIIDLYIAKEMPRFLRGRPAGAISATLLSTLATLGVAASAMLDKSSDMDAARAALEWARPGDLLLLAVHDQREDILALLADLGAIGWQAGAPLPPESTALSAGDAVGSVPL